MEEDVVSMDESGTVVEDVDHSYEYPAIPLALPLAPDHETSMVSSLSQTLTVWDVLRTESGLYGAVESMRNGPRWIAVNAQFPALSLVLMWK